MENPKNPNKDELSPFAGQWSHLQTRKNYFKPLKQKGDIYYSDYFITVSSNLTVKSNLQVNEVHQALDQMLDCTTKPEHIEQIFWIVDSQGNHLRRPLPSDFVKPPKLTVAAEVGQKKKGKRIHIHALYETEHFELLRIDKGAFREVMTHCRMEVNRLQKLNLPNFYLDIKWVPSNKLVKRYARKSVSDFPLNSHNNPPLSHYRTRMPSMSQEEETALSNLFEQSSL